MNEEVYECNDCGQTYVGYSSLWHPDEYVGGHCYCGGSDLKLLEEEEEEEH